LLLGEGGLAAAVPGTKSADGVSAAEAVTSSPAAGEVDEDVLTLVDGAIQDDSQPLAYGQSNSPSMVRSTVRRWVRTSPKSFGFE
jgi:hypothetical protein